MDALKAELAAKKFNWVHAGSDPLLVSHFANGFGVPVRREAGEPPSVIIMRFVPAEDGSMVDFEHFVTCHVFERKGDNELSFRRGGRLDPKEFRGLQEAAAKHLDGFFSFVHQAFETEERRFLFVFIHARPDLYSASPKTGGSQT
jgi:hypothetical protein